MDAPETAWENQTAEHSEHPAALPVAEKTPVEWLRENLRDALSLPPDATDWLIMLYEATQTFDDYADGDEVPRRHFDALLWNTLVAIPQNSFFRAHCATLSPLVAASILKWQAADSIERGKGTPDARSFVWRAGFYDLVLMCVQLVHGPQVAIENAHHVLNLYGESFNDYLGEF